MRMPKWRALKIFFVTLTGSIFIYSLTFYTDGNKENLSSNKFSFDQYSKQVRPTPQYEVIPQRNIFSGKNAATSNNHGSTVIQSDEPCDYVSRKRKSSGIWGRSPSNGLWFNYTTAKQYSFYAYTALYDDRVSLLSDPVIRIIAITFRYDELQAANITVPQFYCGYHFAEDNIIRYVAMKQEAKRIGGGWTLLSEPVKEYIYTCPLLKNFSPMSPGQSLSLPRAVTVVDRPGNVAVTACMPIEVPEKPPRLQDFIVCVQVAYGALNPYSLVEWLEVQRILGVGHVSIYNLSMNGTDSDRVLKHYVNEGFVDVRQTSFIDLHGIESAYEEYLLHGSPVINDCAYRNMHRFNYVIVIDFDEILMPRHNTSLQHLVTFLNEHHPPSNPQAFYVFYNQYYFVDMAPDIRESPYLTFLRHRRRVAVSPYGYAVKSIVSLQGCIQLHNHWCWGVTPAYVASEHPDVVNSNIAVLQHYKRCHFYKDECDRMRSDNITQEEDEGGVWRFRHALRDSVAKSIKSIFGHNL